MKTLLSLLLTFPIALFAQQSDSTRLLFFKDYIQMVVENHPIALKANLYINKADAELLISRGSFDPKYEFDFTRKEFKGSRYYDYIDHGLKVPTWFGPSFKAGFERNEGIYINPTSYTPPEGLWYVGMEIPIGEGLLMDVRRKDVMIAKSMQDMAEADQRKYLSKLILSASKAYWDWYFTYQKMLISKEAFLLAEGRKKMVNQNIQVGDLPAIDSVEINIQWNEKRIDFTQSVNDYSNATLILSNYLWTEFQEPLQVDSTLKPEAPNLKAANLLDSNYIDEKIKNHPEVLKQEASTYQMNLERKFAKNQLLPSMKLSAKYLNTPKNNLFDNLNYGYIQNNYKIEFGLQQSLFLRKDIGKYKLYKIKYESAILDTKMVEREVKNNAYESYNDLYTYQTQAQNMFSILGAYQTMYTSEKMKYNNGASSLFYVNVRENKYLDAKVKYVKATVQYEKAKAQFLWSLGMF